MLAPGRRRKGRQRDCAGRRHVRRAWRSLRRVPRRCGPAASPGETALVAVCELSQRSSRITKFNKELLGSARVCAHADVGIDRTMAMLTTSLPRNSGVGLSARNVEWAPQQARVSARSSDYAIKNVGLPANEQSSTFGSLGAPTDASSNRGVREALGPVQAEIAQAARMTTLELAEAIVHEVNQPLAAIVTNGEVCLRWLDREEPQLDEARAIVAAMIRQARRSSDIIRALHSLSRNAHLQKAELSLNEVIEDVIPLIDGQLRRNIDVDTSRSRVRSAACAR